MTKYRYKVLKVDVGLKVRELIRQTYEAFVEKSSKASSVRIMMPIFVFAPPNIAPSEIMRRIKGKCSMKLFESFPDLKKAIVGATFLGKRLLLRHFWRIDRRDD